MIIFTFATIYKTIWDYSPDSFIVNAEFNLTPLDAARKILQGEPYESMDTTTLTKMNDELVSIQNRKSGKENELKEVEREIDKTDTAIENLYNELSSKRALNIDEYKHKELSGFKEREKQFQLEIDSYNNYLSTENDSIARLPMVKQLSSKKVALAELKLERAKKESNVANYIVENMQTFIPKDLKDKQTNLQNKRINLSEEVLKLEESKKDKKDQLSAFVEKYAEKRKSWLGYIDFLYFSIGISTTTTFGDIIANNKWARLVTTMQLLVCIFIVAGILNQKFSTKKDN